MRLNLRNNLHAYRRWSYELQVSLIELLRRACSPMSGKLYKARFPFKRNRLRCVRCVWMLAANRMLGRSSGNHDWLLSNASACV